MVKVGDEVRASTGFCGVVTSRTEWIRVSVRSQELRRGKPRLEFFNEDELEVVEPSKEGVQ